MTVGSIFTSGCKGLTAGAVLGVTFHANDQDDGYNWRLLYSSKLWLFKAGWNNEGVGQTGRGV